MTPADAIAMLDRQIEAHGEDVVLRRGPASAPTRTGTVRAFVRGYRQDELTDGINQTDSLAIISPTRLGAISWNDDPARGDFVTINGRVRHIEAVGVIKLSSVVVRYELQVRG